MKEVIWNKELLCFVCKRAQFQTQKNCIIYLKCSCPILLCQQCGRHQFCSNVKNIYKDCVLCPKCNELSISSNCLDKVTLKKNVRDIISVFFKSEFDLDDYSDKSFCDDSMKAFIENPNNKNNNKSYKSLTKYIPQMKNLLLILDNDMKELLLSRILSVASTNLTDEQQ